MNVGADANVGADLQVRPRAGANVGADFQVRPRERAQLKQRPCRINDREVSINEYVVFYARGRAP